MVIEIKIKLKQIGRNMHWLAQKTEMAKSHIGYICSGQVEPKKDNLQRIADALNDEIKIFNKGRKHKIDKVKVVFFKEKQFIRKSKIYRLQ